MAIYHLEAKVGSRRSGQSAAATFAYLCRQGRYRRDTSELLHKESQGLPAWAANDPALYWKSADRHERANGRLYQEVEIALPRELPREQQIELARSFALELAATSDGFLPYTLVVHRGHKSNQDSDHKSGQEKNPHAHILLSERIADGHNRTPDTWFRRAAAVGQQSPHLGGARKTAAFQPRQWVSELRERWAHRANAALEQAGSPERIDHRSHAARGMEQLPTVHEGPYARQARERGIADDRVTRNAEIRAANLQLAEIRTHSKTAQMQLDVLRKTYAPEQQLPQPTAAPTPHPNPEAVRFIEAHRRDFATRTEALRWFEREADRLGTLQKTATARSLFDESLAYGEPGNRDFQNVLQTTLLARPWQDAPLSVAASIQQARLEIADWRQTATEIEQRIAGHRDPRSFWRRLLGPDPQRLSLQQKRDSALAQIELHRATIQRIEARWEQEQPMWEQQAAEKNAQRLEKQSQLAAQLRALRPDVLLELQRREYDPQTRSKLHTQHADYMRSRLKRGVAPEELWLDMLLLKDYSRQEQEELETLICEILAEIKNAPARS
jgi:MobA/MobL family